MLKIGLVPVPDDGVPPPVPPWPLPVGTPPVATYSLYRKAPAPINRAWLTMASRAVPPPLDFSEQSDPLPILFI